MTLTDEDVALAAEHALHLDSGPAREAARRRQTTDPDFRAEVAAWEETFAGLWGPTDAVAPPRRVRRRLMRRFAVRRSRSWTGLLAGLLTGTAAAALALVVLVPAPGPAVPEPTVVAEIATEGDRLRVLAAYDPEAGVLRLRRVAGAPPPGRDFELWAIPPGGPSVSLGVLGEAGVVPLPESLRDVLADLTLAVSEEAAGGSTTGLPDRVLASAPVTAL